MALSCPTTIPVEFSTLEISSGTAFPYYRSIKRSKLPACTTKPPFDRASGLLRMVAIKALGGVPLPGLTGRLRAAPTLPPPGCLASAADGSFPTYRHSPRGAREQDTTVYTSISNFFTHLSGLRDSLSETCNSSLQGGNTGRGVKCCLLMSTLDECLTHLSGKEYTL